MAKFVALSNEVFDLILILLDSFPQVKPCLLKYTKLDYATSCYGAFAARSVYRTVFNPIATYFLMNSELPYPVDDLVMDC